MKLSISTLHRLRELLDGETVAASSLKVPQAERLRNEGGLMVLTRGSKRSYKAISTEILQSAISSIYGIDDINAAISLQEGDNTTRAQAVAATGNSKARSVRTFYGFLVNCYVSIVAELEGHPVTISPPVGSYVFIADYARFRIPSDVIVVGIENPENFHYIRRQQSFFKKEIGNDKQLLFVSRYPQNQSKDLIRWLMSIPNQYIHFGDLDLSGVRIYLTEFYAQLGDRASFLIPSDYKERLLVGAAERYDKQLPYWTFTKVPDLRVKPLVDAIHTIHKGYDQEGYIGLE